MIDPTSDKNNRKPRLTAAPLSETAQARFDRMLEQSGFKKSELTRHLLESELDPGLNEIWPHVFGYEQIETAFWEYVENHDIDLVAGTRLDLDDLICACIRSIPWFDPEEDEQKVHAAMVLAFRCNNHDFYRDLVLNVPFTATFYSGDGSADNGFRIDIDLKVL